MRAIFTRPRESAYALFETSHRPASRVLWDPFDRQIRPPPRNRHQSRILGIAQMLEVIPCTCGERRRPGGFVWRGDLNATDQDLEMETLYALTGVNREKRQTVKSFRKRIDHILCGATHTKLNFRASSPHLVLRSHFRDETNEKIPYSDHEGVSAVIRPLEASAAATSTRRILERTLRYMKYSMQAVRQLDDWIRCLPIVGLFSQSILWPLNLPMLKRFSIW